MNPLFNTTFWFIMRSEKQSRVIWLMFEVELWDYAWPGLLGSSNKNKLLFQRWRSGIFLRITLGKQCSWSCFVFKVKTLSFSSRIQVLRSAEQEQRNAPRGDGRRWTPALATAKVKETLSNVLVLWRHNMGQVDCEQSLLCSKICERDWLTSARAASCAGASTYWNCEWVIPK